MAAAVPEGETMSMRVILTNNVPKLGEVGDVCDVAPGYGRNYLIPQGLAILATEGSLKQIDDLKRTERRRQDRVRYDMQSFAGRIGSLDLSFTAHVGETGRLYGSITASDIADAIEAELGEPVDRRKIILDESIRTLGEHQVPIHLMPGVDAQVLVNVVASDEIVQDIGLMAEDDEALDAEAVAVAAEGGEAPAESAAEPEAEGSGDESAAPPPGPDAVEVADTD
jgi:large subunit ribosomal protein L9